MMQTLTHYNRHKCLSCWAQNCVTTTTTTRMAERKWNGFNGIEWDGVCLCWKERLDAVIISVFTRLDDFVTWCRFLSLINDVNRVAFAFHLGYYSRTSLCTRSNRVPNGSLECNIYTSASKFRHILWVCVCVCACVLCCINKTRCVLFAYYQLQRIV